MERKTAVVTGGSQGLGRALAHRLVIDGWSVVIDSRDADRLNDTARELGKLGSGEVVAVRGDVTDDAHRAALADAAQRLGPVALVVNNASALGASPLPRLDAIDPAVLRRVFEVNVVAPVTLLQALAPLMADDVVVVNVSSDAAVAGYEGWGGYGASKAALDQVSRVLAVEHPRWRVYAFDPGDMRTAMHQDAFPGEDISDRPPPESVVPSLIALIEGASPSARYVASEMDAGRVVS